MNKEIQRITASLEEVLNQSPWYGRSVYEMLNEIRENKIYIKPNDHSHSLADLLYHMVTWAEFTQQRIEKQPITDMAAFEANDWRKIDPVEHSWQRGLSALKAAHERIISLLQQKDDSFLEQKVDYREYDFSYLLNGLIQHNIYHIGQVAYVNKLVP